MKALLTRYQSFGLVFSLLLLPWVSTKAQQNPFDIKGRGLDSNQVISDTLLNNVEVLKTQNQQEDTSLLTVTTSKFKDTLLTFTPVDTSLSSEPDTILNPFETNAENPPRGQMETESDTNELLQGLKEITEKLPGIEIGSNQTSLFVVTIVILLLLATLLAINRSMIKKSYRAIANDNFLRFLFREYKSMPWLYWLFYLYFFINGGFFLYLVAIYFNWFGSSNLSVLLGSIIFVAGVYIIKHLTLQVVGSSFPAEKETQLYGFVTMLINILLGILLTPINLVIAFAPEPFAIWAIWAGVVAISLLYIFRQLKGLFISGRFLHSYQFHFFIYLCTAEIAPILIIGKLALGKFGFLVEYIIQNQVECQHQAQKLSQRKSKPFSFLSPSLSGLRTINWRQNMA